MEQVGDFQAARVEVLRLVLERRVAEPQRQDRLHQQDGEQHAPADPLPALARPVGLLRRGRLRHRPRERLHRHDRGRLLVDLDWPVVGPGRAGPCGCGRLRGGRRSGRRGGLPGLELRQHHRVGPGDDLRFLVGRRVGLAARLLPGRLFRRRGLRAGAGGSAGGAGACSVAGACAVSGDAAAAPAGGAAGVLVVVSASAAWKDAWPSVGKIHGSAPAGRFPSAGATCACGRVPGDTCRETAGCGRVGCGSDRGITRCGRVGCGSGREITGSGRVGCGSGRGMIRCGRVGCGSGRGMIRCGRVGCGSGREITGCGRVGCGSRIGRGSARLAVPDPGVPDPGVAAGGRIGMLVVGESGPRGPGNGSAASAAASAPSVPARSGSASVSAGSCSQAAGTRSVSTSARAGSASAGAGSAAPGTGSAGRSAVMDSSPWSPAALASTGSVPASAVVSGMGSVPASATVPERSPPQPRPRRPKRAPPQPRPRRPKRSPPQPRLDHPPLECSESAQLPPAPGVRNGLRLSLGRSLRHWMLRIGSASA